MEMAFGLIPEVFALHRSASCRRASFAALRAFLLCKKTTNDKPDRLAKAKKNPAAENDVLHYFWAFCPASSADADYAVAVFPVPSSCFAHRRAERVRLAAPPLNADGLPRRKRFLPGFICFADYAVAVFPSGFAWLRHRLAKAKKKVLRRFVP